MLFGPESQLRDAAAATIADMAFAESDLRDFNETSFSLNNEDNLRAALAAAWQVPMMASRRVIRITDVRISATGYRDTITENDAEILASYLADPSPMSVVIFIAEDLNRVRKMGKLLCDKATSVEFGNLKGEQFSAIARKQIKDLSLVIGEADVRQLLSRVGADVRRLTNELNKLAAAALPGNSVTSEMIDALVPHSRELSNFDLTDYLIAGRKKQALTALRQMLDDGAEPVALVGLVGSSYRNLLAAKDLMDRGVDRREVLKHVRLPWDKQEAVLGAARRTDIRKLNTALKNIAKTDLAIKTSLGGSGPQAARMQIEMLVCELAVM